MDLTLALVTDIHFGPEARFAGKLRKLTDQAPALLRSFVERMNTVVRPDVVIHLGDAIEDEDRVQDLRRYKLVVDQLAELTCPVVHVAGNHDLVHLDVADLIRVWGEAGPAYRSFDFRGFRLLVLHSVEIKDNSVQVAEDQLRWLTAELRRGTEPVVVVMHHSAADQVLDGNRWFQGRPHICLVQQRKQLRALIEASGRVLLVMNGHLHWNHLSLHGGIPYVTLQSLIENLDDDAPGRAANAHAVVRITERRVLVQIEGAERARYQFARH